MKLAAALKMAASGLALREASIQVWEIGERRSVFKEANDYAVSTGKPLLVVGAPKKITGYHPCGDVTIDISPSVPTSCKYEVADVRNIPYADGHFGAAYISHVLEHLPTIDDAEKALDELHRVADRIFAVQPHKSSLMAWLVPGHHLWVIPVGDGFVIEQRGIPKDASPAPAFSLEVRQ